MEKKNAPNMDIYSPIQVSEVISGNYFFITVNRFGDGDDGESFGAVINLISESYDKDDRKQHAHSIAMDSHHASPYDAAGYAVECALHICENYVEEIGILDMEAEDPEMVALDVTVSELIEQQEKERSSDDDLSATRILH